LHVKSDTGEEPLAALLTAAVLEVMEVEPEFA
jgi:hypothetical protein